MTSNNRIEVLSVASEIFPLVKTGGLADVTGALPAALAACGVQVRSLVPGYPAVRDGLIAGERLSTIDDLFGRKAAIIAGRSRSGDLDLLVLDAPHLFDRPGNPYLDSDGRDWPDNAIRFAALAWAAAEIGRGLVAPWCPDIVHCHDWQAGLAPAYLALAGGKRPATVMTVHNIAFQGQVGAEMLSTLRLPLNAYAVEGVEYFGSIGYLKAGLFYADRLTTVSPTYAAEIQTPAYGMGLEGLLRARRDDLVGIVNGIDARIWDPATDRHLQRTYDAASLDRRADNKLAVQARMGLDDDPRAPLLCVVSRLTWQKGMDLLLSLLPELVDSGAQLALLGSGDTALEHGFIAASRQFAGRVGCIIGYDEVLSHQLQGGADMILVPSRFEPCGLTQLYGLRYGCLPVVARVGGLADTVIDANDAAIADGVATGIQFAPVDVDNLMTALQRAIRLYRRKPVWTAMQQRAMSREVGWPKRAEQYADIYKHLVVRKTAL